MAASGESKVGMPAAPSTSRPGFNLGTGISFPLTDFAALAEVRFHVMLAENKPILTLPISVGAKF